MKGGKMRELSDNETLQISGGSISLTTAVGIGMAVSAVVVFISGILEGFSNPRRCNIEGS